MMNWGQAEQRFETFKREAAEWGISEKDRFELEALARSNLKPVAKYAKDDWVDLDFRSRVAEILTEYGLGKKSERYLFCSRLAYILRCKGEERHEFFSPHYCDLRFCGICSRRQFSRLFAKHSVVLEFLRRNPRPGFRLRQITLTSKNTGEITHEDIKKFNGQVKETLQVLMNGVAGWGALAVLEVGFNNWNLHAHILIYCPYVRQRQLAEVWNRVSGHQVVWINQAKIFGPKALLYLLKYVAKPPSDIPEIIGGLEVAFHKTRRVHAYGLFYNFTRGDEDGEESEWLTCPKCGAGLERVGRSQFTYEFRKAGMQFIGDCPRQRSENKWAN